MTPSPARSPRSWAGSRGGWGRPAATRHPSPARAPRSAASVCHQPRGHPPARGSQDIPRVLGCGAAAHKSSILPARCRCESKGGKMATSPRWFSRPRYPPQARRKGFPLPPREWSGLPHRGPPPPRPESSAREPGWKRGRAPPQRPEGTLRARRESDAGAGAAGSALAHWRNLLTDVCLALSP